jgi:hypothetical protein
MCLPIFPQLYLKKGFGTYIMSLILLHIFGGTCQIFLISSLEMNCISARKIKFSYIALPPLLANAKPLAHIYKPFTCTAMFSMCSFNKNFNHLLF